MNSGINLFNYGNMENLVKHLVDDKVITKKEVVSAMLKVDRVDFIDPNKASIDR